MKNYTPSKASLFLVELIISILFFTVASAVCVQLFSKTHILTMKTRNLNEAVNKVRNAAEAVDSCNGSLSETASLFSQSEYKDGQLFLYYDSSWQETLPQSGRYRVDISVNTDIRPYPVTIHAIDLEKQDEPVYTLDSAVLSS